MKYALGYLTQGQNGLSETELEDVLSCNDEVSTLKLTTNLILMKSGFSLVPIIILYVSISIFSEVYDFLRNLFETITQKLYQ